MFFSNKSIIDASITPMHYFYQKNNIGKLHCDFITNKDIELNFFLNERAGRKENNR